MCVRGNEGEEGGWGSCDPTAPRPAPQAGEPQAHVGAPLTRHELVEANPRHGGGAGVLGGRSQHAFRVSEMSRLTPSLVGVQHACSLFFVVLTVCLWLAPSLCAARVDDGRR